MERDTITEYNIQAAQPNQLSLFLYQKERFCRSPIQILTAGLISQIDNRNIYHQDDFEYISRNRIRKDNIIAMKTFDINRAHEESMNVGDLVMIYRHFPDEILIPGVNIDEIIYPVLPIEIDSIGFVKKVSLDELILSQTYSYLGQKNKAMKSIPLSKFGEFNPQAVRPYTLKLRLLSSQEKNEALIKKNS